MSENSGLGLDTTWPQTIEPSSLYTAEGMVDIDAVAAYLKTIPKPGKEKVPSPLDDMSLETLTLSIDIDEQTEPLPRDIDPEKWRKDNPIDFAVTAFLVHMIRRSQAYQKVWPNPELVTDPQVTLDFREESERFMAFLEENMLGDYEFMADAQEFLGESQNNVHELECVIAIPVAGHQEYQNIFHTLEQFAGQDMPKSKFEIVLYLNLPGKDESNDQVLADSLQLTLNEIQRFKEQYPEVSVRSVVNTFRVGDPVIGSIRADLWNAIIYDQYQRGRSEDILVVSSDADIVSLNTVYVSDMVSTFKEQDVDVVAAQLRWQPVPELPYNAMVNRILRYQSFLDDVRDRHADTFHTADANTGISLTTYMAVGGYDRSAVLGEMRNIINRIRYYRQDLDQRSEPEYVPPEKPIEAKAPHASLRTHSRRLIKAMALGYSPYNAWDQKIITFGSDDSLRTDETPGHVANNNAMKFGDKWVSSMTGPYVADIDPDKKRRILSAAHRMLGFNEFYR